MNVVNMFSRFVNWSDFSAGKIARALQREYSFSSAKSNELTAQQDVFYFNHASVFYTNNSIVKNVDE